MVVKVFKAFNYLFDKVVRQQFHIVRVAMDPSSLEEINRLYDRLESAKTQADLLKDEVFFIRRELEKLTSTGLFQKYVNDVNNALYGGDQNREETDGEPSAKKRKTHNFTEVGGFVVVYTDGACERNGTKNAKAGLGVWFGPGHSLNLSEPVKGKATNNVGEIQACIRALEIAKENDIKKVKIITDSQFVISSMTKWIKNWKKNNWMKAGGKEEVKNKEDFKKLDVLCKDFEVIWEHCPGHRGIQGNEAADALAVNGAKLHKPPN